MIGNGTDRLLRVQIKCGNSQEWALVDSGAPRNYIDPMFVRKHKFTGQKRIPEYLLTGLGGQKLSTVQWEITLKGLRLNGRKQDVTFQIAPLQSHAMVLGREWLRAANPTIDWERMTITPSQRIGYAQDDQGNVFKGFEEMFVKDKNPELPKHQPWDHEINLEKDAQLRTAPIYKMTRRELEEVKKYITENLKRHYIRPSYSKFGSPVLFVPKKQGEIRLVVDYRILNKATIKDRYPLPLISELQEQLAGAKWFTKLDLKEAYYLIRIKEGHEWKTAFRTRYGQFEYTVLPLGLTNAPATFQRLINATLYEKLDRTVLAYLDDILIYTNGSKEDHIREVRSVLKKLAEKGFKLSKEKCEAVVTEVDFLGAIINRYGIKMDPTKTAAIRNWPVPTTLKELQEFLGLTNYYRRFVKAYADKSLPLSALLRKNQKFKWESEQQKAFETLKAEYTDDKILAAPDHEKPFRMETDASKRALSAVLHQWIENDWRPVAFHSRKLQPAEENYDAGDQELLAIVDACKHWRHHLVGAKFPVEVVTDHKNLLKFTTTKELTGRHVRWAETLSSYDLRISHRKGKENKAADALSRSPEFKNTGKKPRGALLKIQDDHWIPSEYVGLVVQEYGTEGLREKYESDTYWKEHGDELYKKGHWWYHRNGGRYLPESMHTQLIKDMHEHALVGHPGRDRMNELLSRSYFIPGRNEKVAEVLDNCGTCKQSKPDRQKPMGRLQALEPAKGPWERIAFDLITKLPTSKEPMTGTEYDAIWVVSDYFTKYAYFIPYKEASSAEELAYMILRTVIAQHGVPEIIISDRASTYTSKFWRALSKRLGIDHRHSTAYHPQTDGMVERLNQTLEQYLRAFQGAQKNHWVEHLPLAQFAYNNSKHSTTGETPFRANYGRNPKVLEEHSTPESGNEAGEYRAKSWASIAKKLQQRKEAMESTANKSRRMEPAWEEGTKVYVSNRNAKIRGKGRKLEKLWSGPYEIQQRLSRVVYIVKFPGSEKTKSFHVSQLKRAPVTEPLAKAAKQFLEEEYEVEEILAERTRRGKRQYLIKWKGYDDSENTWEPEQNLTGSQTLLERFREGQRR